MPPTKRSKYKALFEDHFKVFDSTIPLFWPKRGAWCTYAHVLIQRKRVYNGNREWHVTNYDMLIHGVQIFGR